MTFRIYTGPSQSENTVWDGPTTTPECSYRQILIIRKQVVAAKQYWNNLDQVKYYQHVISRPSGYHIQIVCLFAFPRLLSPSTDAVFDVA
jgi:hypothetical protein